MNIQSKMKTRDAKNNPVTAVLVSVLVMFLLSCLFLLLLAALLYKFDLSESAVKVGIVVIYIVSGVIGGFFMGKIMKTQKFLWVFATGAARISGDKGAVNMDITASTDGNSSFVMPLSSKSNISNADFVVFEQPEQADTLDDVARKKLSFERKHRQKS